MKNQCSTTVPNLITECDQNYKVPKYSFSGDRVYKDGIHFGDVFLRTPDKIHVKIRNGNIYMTGHIVTFEQHTGEGDQKDLKIIDTITPS